MTPTQDAAYQAYLKAGTIHGAAKLLGKDRSTVRQSIRKAQDELLRKGETAEGYRITSVSHRTGKAGGTISKTVKVTEGGVDEAHITHVPDPKKITKTTTVFAGSDRRVERQWVMEKPEDADREKLWLAFAETLEKRVAVAKLVPQPKVLFEKNRLVVYTIGDHHTGQLSWGVETGGENYDLKIARKLLSGATNKLVNDAPATEECVVGFAGDFSHTDGYKPVTPLSGHQLDADVRFPKIAEACEEMMAGVIDRALQKHKIVHVIVTAGNHDPVTTVWLRIAMRARYGKNPRVKIDRNPGRYHYFRWGTNLLGFTHGDRIKPASLPGIMSVDRAKDWGETTCRVWFTGHVHHDEVIEKEYTGAKVIKLRVLAPLDAHAAGAGYRSGADMKAWLFDRKYGEAGNLIAPAAMFREAA